MLPHVSQAVILGDKVKKKSASETPSKTRRLEEDSKGALYLVGTPIGNLEDMTLRGLRILREADLIACEDTRQTQKLLNHFEIKTSTISYHEHNELVRAPELVLRLEEGASIALVSDAGMPGVSDPGFHLVSLCIRHHIPVIPVPGPSALIAGLVASGLPTHSVFFFGFLPPKTLARRKVLEQLHEATNTLVFFDSPHRIVDSLKDVQAILGDRAIVVARELTKIHEEFLRGRCSEVLATLQSRADIAGEITLLVSGKSDAVSAELTEMPLKERVEALMNASAMSRMDALKAVARERKISKRDAYREFES